ncbi:17080_t:CDS:2, partial [Funneliformis geosporum]
CLSLKKYYIKQCNMLKGVYEKAISTNEAAARIENAINKSIKEYKSSGEKNDIDCNDEVVKGSAKKKLSWYTTTLIKSSLSDEHPDEIKKIKSNKNG